MHKRTRTSGKPLAALLVPVWLLELWFCLCFFNLSVHAQRPATSWGPCPTREDGLHSKSTLVIECAYFDVPLDWESPDGENITLFVKRVLSPFKATSQLWLFPGGPGTPNSELEVAGEGIMATFNSSNSVDLYGADPRGTGFSTYLGCPGVNIQENTPECIQVMNKLWGDKIHHFSTTNTAKDYGYVMNLTRKNYSKTFIWGNSWGTFVTNRFLQMFPKAADAVLLEGLCPPDLCRYETFDYNTNAAGLEVLRLCGMDATCINHLGFDVWGAVENLYAMLNNNTLPCQKFLSVTSLKLKALFGGQFMATWPGRALIAPTIFRLLRCNTEDVQELSHTLFNKHSVRTDNQKGLFDKPPMGGVSILMSWNVLFSEQFALNGTQVPSLQEFQKIRDAAWFITGAFTSPANIRQYYDSWNKYQPDQYYNRYATDYKGPLLMLNGNLDQAAPLLWSLTEAHHFQGEKQQIVVVPFAPHGVIANSPVAGSVLPCGLSIMASFFSNQALDLSCIEKVLPIDFAGTRQETQELALAVFGSSDVWEAKQEPLVS